VGRLVSRSPLLRPARSLRRGRPIRFSNMFRVFKVTSPMSRDPKYTVVPQRHRVDQR
jgi:hypothetical protein